MHTDLHIFQVALKTSKFKLEMRYLYCQTSGPGLDQWPTLSTSSSQIKLGKSLIKNLALKITWLLNDTWKSLVFLLFDDAWCHLMALDDAWFLMLWNSIMNKRHFISKLMSKWSSTSSWALSNSNSMDFQLQPIATT